VAVFVDGGYLNHLCKTSFGSRSRPFRVNYRRLGENIARECGGVLFRTYYYHAKPFQSKPPTEDERRRKSAFDRFLQFLDGVDRMEVRLGRVRRYYDEEGNVKFEQKGVDVKLAIDALKLSLKGKIHKVAFVTGDSDFIPVVEAIKDEGIEVCIFYHPSSVNWSLVNVCDKRVEIKKSLLG